MENRPTYEELEQRIRDLEREKKEAKRIPKQQGDCDQIYRQMMENISDTVIITDDHGEMVYVSSNTTKIFGLSREQVYNQKNIQRLINGTACDFETLKKEQEIENIEWSINDLSGEEHFLLISAKLVNLNGGTILYVMRDITDRKIAEEKLKESEERFRAIFEQGANAMALVDTDSCDIIEFNQHAHEDLGYSREEFEELSFTDIEAVESPEKVKARRDKIRRIGFDAFETRYITKDGELRDMLISSRKLNIPGKNQIMSIWTDITERKQAERERLSYVYFLENMDRVNRAIQGANDLEQMMSDVLGEVLSIFKTDRAFLGYPCDPRASSWHIPMERTRPEYPGAAVLSVEVPMDEDAINLNRALLSSNNPVKFGPSSNFDHPLSAKLTEHFSIQSQIIMAIYPKVGQPWTFGTHQCSHVRVWTPEEGQLLKGIGQRIADSLSSLLMYRKLRDSEDKYRTMMEAFVEPLYICSHDFIIEYMNPAMIRRIGRDATGEKCYTALHGLGAKCEWCAFQKIFKDENFQNTIRSPLDDRNYRISSMPIKNKDGTISKMTINRDITDYMVAVSEKEKAQAQLMQSQKMESIGNLAGGIAHDFNNILSSIIGFTELALDNVEKGSKIESDLQGVYTAGLRAKELVAQILIFARQSESELKPIQIYIVVKEVLQFIRSSIPTTIEIKSNNINSKSYVMGNPTQIHQIMMNLFTNAAFAMEESGGLLTVSLKDTIIEKRVGEGKIGLKEGRYVELSVSDTGTGIPPEFIDSIFEPYFTTKGSGEGTGMGLAVVYGIVESYGGKITVGSTYGKGTTFTIYLPASQKRNPQRQCKNEPLPTGTERVLFVDDEAPIAKMGALCLEGFGYSVTIRTSSLEALELFRANPNRFDLVITDMTMPNMTGDKLSVELMKIRPGIPIILCTGYSKKISDATASKLGIRAFAYKPVVKADLVKTVRKVLDEAKA
jgi:PAS domain S-box-containing protein